MFNERNKNVWKLLLLVFIISFIALNWSDIYWIFNPKVALKGVESLVIREDELVREKGSYSEEEDSIEILAIDIKAPIIETEGTTDDDYKEALDRGVVHFPDSVYPGERGISVLLGHSAPPGWPKINHDWVFSDVEKLERGDEIVIHFKNRKYVFEVTERVFLEIGEDIPAWTSNEPEIILLSCWPPGKNIKRIGVRGVLTK